MFVDELMHCAKVNWRNFNEFFLLILDFARAHYLIAEYMINQANLVYVLLEFVMNNKTPHYQSSTQFKMGDMVDTPNFQHVYELLAYLIKCSLTRGVRNVSQYSPESAYQEEEKCIHLPE